MDTSFVTWDNVLYEVHLAASKRTACSREQQIFALAASDTARPPDARFAIRGFAARLSCQVNNTESVQLFASIFRFPCVTTKNFAHLHMKSFWNLKLIIKMLDLEMQRCKHVLKQKIMGPVKFHGFEDSRKTLTKLVRRAVCDHESNSALLIGPPGSGKTTVIIAIALGIHVLIKL